MGFRKYVNWWKSWTKKTTFGKWWLSLISFSHTNTNMIDSIYTYIMCVSIYICMYKYTDDTHRYNIYEYKKTNVKRQMLRLCHYGQDCYALMYLISFHYLPGFRDISFLLVNSTLWLYISFFFCMYAETHSLCSYTYVSDCTTNIYLCIYSTFY